MYDLGDLFNRVLHAGGGFVVDDGDDIVFLFFNRFGDHFGENGLTPGDFDFISLLAVGGSYFVPALGERAVDAAQHAPGGKVADSGFLAAGAGGGEDEDARLGGKELLRFFAGSLEDNLEIFAAVGHHGLSLGCQDRGIDIDRTRDEHG